MKYSVQYKKYGIWHRMNSFDTYDEAEEFRRDQEYFDMMSGFKTVRYRIRKVYRLFEKEHPENFVFGEGYSPHGNFLFSDGTYGYIGEDSNYDPEDFLEEGETEDDLIRDGREPIGAIYFDRWTKDGEFIQGGCFLYYDGETMKDWCDRNGEPYPVKRVKEKMIERFENGDLSDS